MTVAELKFLLELHAADDARVLVFDEQNIDRTSTIEANCILSMNHNGQAVIICRQIGADDPDA